MHSQRVTFLTNAEHKAQLDSFAAARGESVGNVVRDATMRYMSGPPQDHGGGEQQALDRLLDELEAAMPVWNARFDSMEASIARARRSIHKALAAVDADK